MPNWVMKPRVRVIEMEVAAQAELLRLDFVGAEEFARSAHRVVDRLVEVVGVGNIGADLRREELRVEGDVLIARIAIQPGPVPVRPAMLSTRPAFPAVQLVPPN
jgi:hypothetical protein